MTKTITALALALVLLAPGGAAARPADEKGIKELFAKMEQGLREKKEALFQEQWHPEGYEKNLVGGSGIPGRSVYRQGSRKGWYLKPELGSIQTLPGRKDGPLIVRCPIWSWKKQRAVDKVHALLVRTREKEARLVLLGAGERLAQVIALGQRWVEKKPLAPKKR